MFTAAFWKATTERVIRTFAAVLASGLGLDKLGVVHANWSEALSFAAGSALLTLLLALAASRVGPTGPGLTETTNRITITRV